MGRAQSLTMDPDRARCARLSGVTMGVCGAAGRTAAKRYSRVKKVSEIPAVHAKAQNEHLTLTDLLPICAEALPAADTFVAAAQPAVARRCPPGGNVAARRSAAG